MPDCGMFEPPARDEVCGDGSLPPEKDGKVAQSSAISNSAAFLAGSAAESLAIETLRYRFKAALRRWARRARETAQGAVFRGAPQLAAAVLEIEARGLGPAHIPHLFARDLTQIPPTLNDDLLDLYGRSEQALANRFGFFGEMQQLEALIAWEPPRGRAWRAELHSFDYALDLALTFRISGQERFARHLRYLIADWISANPPAGGSGWAACPLARRIRNWVLAADLAREAFERDAAFLELFSSSLAQQVTYLGWLAGSLDDASAVWMASRALLLAGRFFPRAGAERGSTSLTAMSLPNGSSACAADELRSTGGGPESLGRHSQPLRQFELAAVWCDHALFAGEEHAAEHARSELLRALETLEGMLHPDGTLPLFGPEPLPSAGAVAELFAVGAAVLSVARWKSLCGGELGILPYMLLGESGKLRMGLLPPETWRADSRLDAESGIFRLSDGQSSALLVSAQPAISAEDHQDLFSFELTVRGQRTVVDSGIFAPPGEADASGLAAAHAHNVLLVDGRPPCPRIFRLLPRAVASLGGVQGIWLRAGAMGRHDASPLGGNSYARGFFLIEGRYWVVLDCLAGSGTHRVESLVHLYPAFSLEVRDDRAVARSGAASVAFLPLSIASKNLKSVSIRNTSEAGWHAPAAGVRYPSRALEFEWEAVELPWVGGYMIDSAADINLTTNVASRSSDEVTLNIGSESYSLELPS